MLFSVSDWGILEELRFVCSERYLWQLTDLELV
jgi:hypothetical protein